MTPPYKENAKPFFPLFAKASPFVQSSLVALGSVITELLNQNPTQRSDLKYAIQDLSAMLTNERTELVKPYWTSSRLTAAYTSFFLPWNLIRLTQLFPYLELPRVEENDIVIDLGSGPLTAIIALWISRPDYREMKLNVIASDTAGKPMEIGQAILKKLAEKLETPFNWTLQLEKKNAVQAVKNNALNIDRKPKLLMSANVFNEIETRQGLQKNEVRTFFNDYTKDVKNLLAEDGAYLAIEPGNRQGGRITTIIREQSIRNEIYPYSPCPHPFECPILNNPHLKTWCHLQCPTYAPTWLKEISKEAKLERDNLSISFVLLKPFYEGVFSNTGRIISNAFLVPELGRCRYLCSDRGLLLLPQSANLPHSALVSITLTDKRDKKSRAYIAKINN